MGTRSGRRGESNSVRASSSEGRCRAAALVCILALVSVLAAAFAQPPWPDQRALALQNPRHALWSRAAPEVYRVRIETTKGTVILEATRALAPRGADRFYHLVETGFYDDSRFFRVISGRFAQFGIPGQPALAAIWRNDRIADDVPRARNVRGTFAYAMTGPGTRTTQIYINTGDQSRLDPEGFAPFGKVVDGLDVVDRLYSGYGERSGGGMRAGRQQKLFEEGNSYLDGEFPLLDRLLRALLE